MARQQKARAVGTTSNQRSGVLCYLAFCHSLDVPPFQPTYQDICTYVEYVVSHSPAPATVRNKISQVRVFLQLSEGDVSAFNHPRTLRALDALDRDKSYVQNLKLPIETVVFSAALMDLGASPIGTVVRAAMLLIYYGALRQSELLPRTVKTWSPQVQPTREDIKITHDAVVLYIKTGKNLNKVGQFREVVMRSAEEEVFCPVRVTRQAMELGLNCRRSDPILVFPGSNNPVTAPYVTRSLHNALRNIGASDIIPTTSLHSLRKTAATQAFSQGCSELSIRNYGAWSSSAYKQYILTSNATVNQSLIKSLNT